MDRSFEQTQNQTHSTQGGKIKHETEARISQVCGQSLSYMYVPFRAIKADSLKRPILGDARAKVCTEKAELPHLANFQKASKLLIHRQKFERAFSEETQLSYRSGPQKKILRPSKLAWPPNPFNATLQLKICYFQSQKAKSYTVEGSLQQDRLRQQEKGINVNAKNSKENSRRVKT